VAGYTDGEPGQARYLVDAYETLLAANVTVVVWACLHDYPSGGGSYEDSGLVTTTLSMKDAFQSYYQLATGSTPPPPPPVALTLSTISVILTKPGTPAQVQWTTSVAADSQVEFGRTAALGSVVRSSALSTSHSLSLGGLARRTTYYFRVTSKTSDGRTVSSAILSFKTK